MVPWEGKLFMFGGVTRDYVEFAVHAFDPAAQSWSPVAFEGKLPQPRVGFGLALCGPSAYVFGGSRDNAFFNDTFEFKLETKQIVPLGVKKPAAAPPSHAPSKRYGHAMCGDSDRVYVYGGYFKNQVLGDLWVMDGIGRTWKEITVNQDEDLVPEPRAFCTLCCTNGKLYMFGGWDGSCALGDLWVIDDVELSEWREVKCIEEDISPSPRMNHAAAMGPDGRMFVFGGSNYVYHDDLWIFDCILGEWTQWQGGPEAREQRPHRRAKHAMCCDEDCAVYVFGGWFETRKLNDLHCIQFNPASPQRERKRSISPLRRMGLGKWAKRILGPGPADNPATEAEAGDSATESDGD